MFEGFPSNTKLVVSQRVFMQPTSVKEGVKVLGFKNNDFVKSEVLEVTTGLSEKNDLICIDTYKGNIYCTPNQKLMASTLEMVPAILFSANDQLFSKKQSLIIRSTKVVESEPKKVGRLKTTNGYFIALDSYNDFVFVNE